jgi:hypothetical protein
MEDFMDRKRCFFPVISLALLLFAGGNLAAAEEETLALVTIHSTGIVWRPMASSATLLLTVSGPENYFTEQSFANGASPVFYPAGCPEGEYTYELRQVVFGAANESDSSSPGNATSAPALTQSGHFMLRGGLIVTGGTESGAATTMDVVHADDVIVTGSQCIGFDCLTDGTENFGFDTLKLKENNLQIYFDDTSATAGFPANDWRIRTNDSSSGGASYFAIDDSTAGHTPFKIMAGAPASSIFVSGSGYLGVGTATPTKPITIVRSGEPAAMALRYAGGASMFVSANADYGNIGTSTPSALRFFVNNVLHLRLDTDGSLSCANGAKLTAGGVWTNASSITLKNNVRELKADSAMRTLAGLNPVTFTYKTAPDEAHVGFIAEEVPELVASKDRLGVSSMDIVAVLTKVVQEQARTIAELKERVKKLEARSAGR